MIHFYRYVVLVTAMVLAGFMASCSDSLVEVPNANTETEPIDSGKLVKRYIKVTTSMASVQTRSIGKSTRFQATLPDTTGVTPVSYSYTKGCVMYALTPYYINPPGYIKNKLVCTATNGRYATFEGVIEYGEDDPNVNHYDRTVYFWVGNTDGIQEDADSYDEYGNFIEGGLCFYFNKAGRFTDEESTSIKYGNETLWSKMPMFQYGKAVIPENDDESISVKMQMLTSLLVVKRTNYEPVYWSTWIAMDNNEFPSTKFNLTTAQLQVDNEMEFGGVDGQNLPNKYSNTRITTIRPGQYFYSYLYLNNGIDVKKIPLRNFSIVTDPSEQDNANGQYFAGCCLYGGTYDWQEVFGH